MLALIKVIGFFSAVAIPTSVCGAQVFLTQQKQTEQVQKINKEIADTGEAFKTASANYEKEISRIKEEKNNLAITKTNLTYIPVEIQSQITSLSGAKTEYESSHKTTQEEITTAITNHKNAVTNAQTTIENLWTTESARVKAIQTKLESEITAAKQKNQELSTNIESIKTSIDTQINNIFNPPT